MSDNILIKIEQLISKLPEYTGPHSVASYEKVAILLEIRDLIKTQLDSNSMVQLLPIIEQLKHLHSDEWNSVVVNDLYKEMLSVLSIALIKMNPSNSNGYYLCLIYESNSTHKFAYLNYWGYAYVFYVMKSLQIHKHWFNINHPQKRFATHILEMVLEYSVSDKYHYFLFDCCDLMANSKALINSALGTVESIVDADTHESVCSYLYQNLRYNQENREVVLEHVFYLYEKYNRLFAVDLAVELHSSTFLLKALCNRNQTDLFREQMAFIISRYNVCFYESEFEDDRTIDHFIEMGSNYFLSRLYINSGYQMGLIEPLLPFNMIDYCNSFRMPQSITNLNNNKQSLLIKNMDYTNLGIIFSNCLLNAGFSDDFIFKNMKMDVCNDTGMVKFRQDVNYNCYERFYGVASFGILNCWRHKLGLFKLHEFLNYCEDKYIQSGVYMAIGLQLTTMLINDRCEANLEVKIPVLRMLKEMTVYVNSLRNGDHQNVIDTFQIIAIVQAFGYLFVGSQNLKAITPLTNILDVPAGIINRKVHSYCALSVALISFGYEGFEMNMQIDELFRKYLPHLTKLEFIQYILSIVLLHFTDEPAFKRDQYVDLIDIFNTVNNLSKIFHFISLNDNSYINELKNICMNMNEKSLNSNVNMKKLYKFDVNLLNRQISVIGIALISMNGHVDDIDDVDSSMVLQLLQRIYEYWDELQSVVPLAIAILYISNPKNSVIKILADMIENSKNVNVTRNAMYGLGLIGAGTKNYNIENIFKNYTLKINNNNNHHLSSFDLCIKNISHSLLYLGKGTITLNPFRSHYKHNSFSHIGMIGILSSILHFIACCNDYDEEYDDVDDDDDKESDLMMYTRFKFLFDLTLSIYPRALITVNEMYESISVLVKVYKCKELMKEHYVEKKQYDIRRCMTPVLLDTGEQAELIDTNYEAVSKILHGIVICKFKFDNLLNFKFVDSNIHLTN